MERVLTKSVPRQFHTNQERKLAFCAATARQQAYDRPADDFDVYMLDTSGGTEAERQTDLTDNPHSIPGTCVGLWLTMRIVYRKSDTVEALGPILVKGERE